MLAGEVVPTAGQRRPAPTPVAPAASGAPVLGVADELLKLKQLLDAGAITQAEYAQQKARLLTK